jgi:2,3-bisphosphoglycerate-independent phosphoglycerate mutase
MDGLGWKNGKYGNAVEQSGVENLKKLMASFPTTFLTTHGSAVGLEDGQMGGSEVGHLNIGAGRIVLQELTKINDMIKQDTLSQQQEIQNLFNHVKINNSTLHLMGLVSDGGIHSHINHIRYLIKSAKAQGIQKVVLHAFTDGRDTLKNSGKDFVLSLEKEFAPYLKISSICGRLYAMDREKRYDRLQKAYNMLVLGKAESYHLNVESAFDESYNNQIFDEYIEPAIIGRVQKIQSGDGVFFFNFRSDRARQLSQAIAEQNIEEMELVNLKNLYFVSLTEYNSEFKNVKPVILPEKVKENLAKILSEYGKKQLHISETTKYAHVTFFLNGGIEKPYIGEDRKLIESFDVKDFSQTPQMRAVEITQYVLEAITQQKYDFIIVNLSNADMIGHTGDIEATKEAVRIVDKCAYLITLATLSAGGHALVTADHGNAEEMLDEKGNVVTSHSKNLVPFILASEQNKTKKLKDNQSLTAIAPTILKLLDLEKPIFMDEPLF